MVEVLKNHLITPEIEKQMIIHAAKCPICKEYHSCLKTDKLAICGSCRLDIIYCNKENKKTCFDCINIFAYASIDNLYDAREVHRYGCVKGSRLAKLSKKLKLRPLDIKKYLRWRV